MLSEIYDQSLEKAQAGRRSVGAMRDELARQGVGRFVPEDQTWLWSDLHLHHDNIIRYCDRPFKAVGEMNDVIMGAWKGAVSPRDTMLCLGDVALAGASNAQHVTTIRAMPGYKVLVRGNHDFTRRGRALETGFDRVEMALVIEGDPRLILTHIPLDDVPAGSVNVHGHVHNNEGQTGPYINVCVEQIGYCPISLDDVRRLAAIVVDGQDELMGRTTIERLYTSAA